jgi:probable HAF family extracellular repeat protein
MAALIGLALVSALVCAARGSSTGAQASFATVDLGDSTSTAEFVNDAGQVAGVGPSAAFLWSAKDGLVSLGKLGGASVPTLAGLSESGQIVGRIWFAGSTYSAFSWTQAGGLDAFGIPLGYSASMGVNDQGQVAGWMLSYPSHGAFLWTKSGGLVPLGALNDGSSDGEAINNAGTVVGGSYVTLTPPVSHAFLWTKGDGLVDLGTLGGTQGYAQLINDAGQVTGFSTTTAGEVHAFSWMRGAGMVDVGTLGGTTSNPTGLSASGQVVGFSTTSAGDEHAFSWTATGGIVDLGTLGGSVSHATAVDDAGRVVGYSTTGSGDKHAFSWTATGGMIDLGTLGGNTSAALDVNDSGDVVGYAFTESGQQHAVVWQDESVPALPAPSTPDLSAASDDGPSSSDDTTSKTSLVFTGTAQPGLTVTLLRDGQAGGTATAGPDGAWTIGDTVPGVGSYTYTARAADGGGHLSPVSGSLVVTVVSAEAASIVDLGVLGCSLTAINQHGEIVGTHDNQACTWTQAGGTVMLGTLGGTSSYPYGLTDGGEVFGNGTTASGAMHAFRWTPGGGMVDLGLLDLPAPGTGGLVGGNAASEMLIGHVLAGSYWRGFVWTPQDGRIDLGTLGGPASDPAVVTDGGEVFGFAMDASGDGHIFRWSRATGMVDLGKLPASVTGGTMKAGGIFLGSLQSSTGEGDAFVWTPSAGLIDLGKPGTASLVNGKGLVVGTYASGSGGRLMFTWTKEGGWVGRGNLDGPSAWMDVTSLSDDGRVVGTSFLRSGPSHAFSWTEAGGIVDLGALPGDTNTHPVLVTPAGDIYGTSGGPNRPTHLVLWSSSPHDLTPPVLHLPSAVTAEATSPAGATVSFSASATDNVDPTPVVVCNPASGAVLPVGSTTVACTATDASGNHASASFVVHVVDTTGPTVHVPANMTVEASSASGATVEFTASATDTVDPSPVVVCVAASGSVFAVGDTTVTCKATDASGNTATASFVVHVRGAAEQLANLAAKVVGVGPGTSLADKVAAAETALAAGNRAQAASILNMFTHQVAAQTGKKIPLATAATLTATAQRIIAVLG